MQKEIKEVEARLSKEIHLLDLKIAENTSKIAETKAELVLWVVGIGLLQTTLISGITQSRASYLTAPNLSH